MHGNRINWIDHARAMSIILVVMMHSTLGVEKVMGVEGWMNHVVAFATPFRIPAFFLISGLLLTSALKKPLAEFLDRRVFTLLYLYVVWVTIQFGFKAPGMVSDMGAPDAVLAYFTAFVQPFGTLWFIYVLPIFFLIARLVQNVPKSLILLIALLVHIAPIHTGWLIIDETANRFFYFFLGHMFANQFHFYAQKVVDFPRVALAGISAWAVTYGMLLHWSAVPVLHVAYAISGSMSLITIAALLRFVRGTGAVRWIGRNTITIYLGFFLPMAISRTVLTKSGIIHDPGTISVLVTLSAIIGSILMFLVARKVGIANIIYRKPAIVRREGYFGIERRRKPRFRMIAAE